MKQYIQPFISVCENVFLEFLGEKLEVKLPYFVGKDEVYDWDVSAIIGLIGEARGAVVLSMRDELALKLTNILAAGRMDNIDQGDVMDTVGEIVNIIAGNVKYELEESFKLVISLPTLIKGKEHSISWPDGQTNVICIPFTIFNKENFSLFIALEAVKS